MRKLFVLGAAAVSLAAMPGALRAQSADALNGQSQPAEPSTTAVISSDPSVPDTVVTDYPGNAASVPSAAPKTYPVCTRQLQDNCQNRGEGGAPGRSRALDHWPGKPASE